MTCSPCRLRQTKLDQPTVDDTVLEAVNLRSKDNISSTRRDGHGTNRLVDMNVTILAKGRAIKGRAQAFGPWYIHRLSISYRANVRSCSLVSSSESGDPRSSIGPIH